MGAHGFRQTRARPLHEHMNTAVTPALIRGESARSTVELGSFADVRSASDLASRRGRGEGPIRVAATLSTGLPAPCGVPGSAAAPDRDKMGETKCRSKDRLDRCARRLATCPRDGDGNRHATVRVVLSLLHDRFVRVHLSRHHKREHCWAISGFASVGHAVSVDGICDEWRVRRSLRDCGWIRRRERGRIPSERRIVSTVRVSRRIRL